jgi:pyruvate,water dikinase
MVYTAQSQVGRTTQFVDVDQADRRTFSLSDADITELAREALTIEEHYGRPMDIEWGEDGHDGRLYILQARPETLKSRQSAAIVQALSSRKDAPLDKRSVPAPCGCCARLTRCISSTPVRCWWPT